MAKRKQPTAIVSQPEPDYGVLVTGISELLIQARRMSVRSTNSILTATYWEIGRRIVEFEQGGKARAEYGEGLLKRLGKDLIAQHGRGFSWRNLFRMRGFYLAWEILPTPSAIFEARVRQPHSHGANMPEICQTVSGASAPDEGFSFGGVDAANRKTTSAKSRARKILQTPSAELPQDEGIFSAGADTGKGQTPSAEPPFGVVIRRPSETPSAAYAGVFPLAWSHYVRLMSVVSLKPAPSTRPKPSGAAGPCGSWTGRSTPSSTNARRTRNARPPCWPRARSRSPKTPMTVEDELRDPYLLEFLNLKDEYSETELEEALIRHLEWFLLELGTGFTFVARQKRIRIGGTWYRIDLLLYHRGLRCLVVIDLKTGRVHPCRCRADEPVPELRQTAPDAARRGRPGGHHPLLGEGRRGGGIRDRRHPGQGVRVQVPDEPAGQRDPAAGNPEYPARPGRPFGGEIRARSGIITMEAAHKKILKAISLELRHLLEGQYDASPKWQPGDLEKRLAAIGVRRDREPVSVDELAHLAPADQKARQVVDAYLKLRAEAGVSREDAVAEFVRETAYTWANRLLALRCMEARELIDEVILQKPAYGGRSLEHHRLAQRQPELCAGEDDGLLAALDKVFAEQARHLPMLFDPEAPGVALKPSAPAIKRCVALLSGTEAVRGQEPATGDVFKAPDALGWAYQYWNTEEKDRVFTKVRTQKGAKIEGADIVPATQLYTESYMVKFLVQNSLGATWMGMHPESKLSEKWEYYVRDADRAPVERKPIAEVTFLDPACGSGHFLLEAFDLCYDMYKRKIAACDSGALCVSHRDLSVDP